MIDKIRPKTITATTSSSRATPLTRITTTNMKTTKTTTSTTSSKWVIVQFCFILIQILATLVPPTNCDKLTPISSSSLLSPSSPSTSSSSSPSSSSSVRYIRANNGDKLLHRVARLTKLDNYSLLSSADTAASSNNNKNNFTKSSSSISHRDRPNSAGYKASTGLRTRSQPQKFYSQKERSSVTDNLISLNLVREPPKDICDGHCNCERVNAFATVTCDYQKNPRLNPIFDRTFKVPHNARVIIVKLAARTQFRLDDGFLNNNTVNRFVVEGNMQEGEQVEINSNAFSENYGPYPEIGFSNVFAIVIRSKAFQQKGPASYKFNITNSNDVLLLENAFENTKIRGQFVGIKDLRITEKAFKSAQARLHIDSSNIDNIFRFEASMQEIKFVNCTIGTINPGAFDVYDIKLLRFESCRIDAIKSRAITDKFFSEHVTITGASIGLIESDAIYGSGISELKITNNKIDTIYDNAIHVISAYVTITGNKVKHLGHNWLHVEKWAKFIVDNNQFGVFGRMLLENEQNSTSCNFEGNSLTEPQDGSLNFTKPYCKIREISVKIPCRCDRKWLDKLSDNDLRTEIYCTIDDKLGNCFNATTFNFMKYFIEVCDESKTILDCVANKNLKKIEGRFYTPEELEQKNRNLPQLIMILAGTIILIMLIIAVVLFLTCHFRKRNSKLQRGESASSSGGRNHIHEFSADERNVIDQTLQLIQKKYPEIYKKVNERIQIMYIQDISEEKCVKATSQIVNLLNKIQNPGTDFMAFNRVLTEHLQCPLPTAPPADQSPIYSEPSLTGMDEGFYTSTTFSNMDGSIGGVGDGPHGGNGPEHIYAEPSCAQQPLLRNEYASPADGHLTSMDVYTEPINERELNLTTPYAVTRSLARPYQSPYRPIQYATPMRNNQQQHLHHHQQRQHQLPDVLSQHPNNTGTPTTLSNVRKLAQDLQGTDDIELDMRGAAALPLTLPPHATSIHQTTTDSGSNHSGGSNETVQIDDVIEYVDS